jgi:hypothetical protein
MVYLIIFFYLTEDAWLLIYGKADCKPLVLCLAHELGKDFCEQEIRVINQLITSLQLPFIHLAFDSNDHRDNFYFEQGCLDFKFNEISSDELKMVFSDLGLNVTGVTNKQINKTSSSKYHNWQRQNLGKDTVVSDVDLLRLNDNKVIEIIELKRSYLELEKWIPFKADYPNFNLVGHAFVSKKIRFTIAYNKFTKRPYNDDTSQIKIFDCKFVNKQNYHGVFTLERFLKGHY